MPLYARRTHRPGDAVHLRKAGMCLLLWSTVVAAGQRARSRRSVLPRNIFTNKAVGGLAAAIVGLGLAIGAAHQQAPATKADATPAKAEQVTAVVAATAPAAAKP